MSEDSKPFWEQINKQAELIAQVDKKTDLNAMQLEQQRNDHNNLMERVVHSEGKIDGKQDALLSAVSKLEGKISMAMWGVPLTLSVIAIVAGVIYQIVRH